tara:strand:+ start:178 stop:351 length:174 start_codon:yes stop_codon:yes gene_type:complete
LPERVGITLRGVILRVGGLTLLGGLFGITLGLGVERRLGGLTLGLFLGLTFGLTYDL